MHTTEPQADPANGARTLTFDELNHLLELASALRCSRLYPGWLRELEIRGQMHVWRTQYERLPASERSEVDRLLWSLPLVRRSDAERLTISFN